MKGYRLYQPKEEMHRAESRKALSTKPPVAHSQWSHRQHYFPSNDKGHQRSLVSRVFIEVPSHRHSWLPTSPISVSRPSRSHADTTGPKIPTLNHIFRWSSVTQGSQTTKDMTVFRDYLSEAEDKGPGKVKFFTIQMEIAKLENIKGKKFFTRGNQFHNSEIQLRRKGNKARASILTTPSG